MATAILRNQRGGLPYWTHHQLPDKSTGALILSRYHSIVVKRLDAVPGVRIEGTHAAAGLGTVATWLRLLLNKNSLATILLLQNFTGLKRS